MGDAWAVLTLFLIPVGGGIPAGVLLGRARGLPWPETAALYLVSDAILACAFEPLLTLAAAAGRRIPALSRAAAALRRGMDRTIAGYGSGPLALILIAFGVDPMTGRTAAAAAGHGFVSGWALAIAGDMMYFGVLMVSTLWLNSILGDGLKTMAVMLAAMLLLPALIQRWRRRAAPDEAC